MVVWLQAGTCYADLRTPLHPQADSRCFAGRSFWDGDLYRWTHVLDAEAPPGGHALAADDAGELYWQGDAMVERGLFPTPDGPVSYEEEWVRLPGAGGPWLALEGPGSCLIRVGDHAITVVDDRPSGGAFAAVYRVRRHDMWEQVTGLGPAQALPDPSSSPAEWRVVHQGDGAQEAS